MRFSQPAEDIRARGWRSPRNAIALAVVLLGVIALGSWILVLQPPPAGFEAEPAKSAASAKTFTLHATPRPVADVVFQDASGAKRHLAEFRGRVVLLNLWATWCAPCREEMPTLDRLQSRLGGKDFEVIALSIDRDGATVVKRFFDATNVHALAIYVDPTMEAQGKLDAIGIPTTVLIDRQGREVARRTGPASWDGPEAIAVIQRYLVDGAR